MTSKTIFIAQRKIWISYHTVAIEIHNRNVLLSVFKFTIYDESALDIKFRIFFYQKLTAFDSKIV